jgi:hypothetical protein
MKQDRPKQFRPNNYSAATHTLEHSSKSRVAAGVVLALLGNLGLVISSFYSLSGAIFFWPSDRLRLPRVVLVLGVSIVLFFGAARVFRDSRHWRGLIPSLPFVIGGFGCLGVISTVAHLFFHRQPHSATGYETTWFFVGVVGFVFSVFFLRRRARLPTPLLLINLFAWFLKRRHPNVFIFYSRRRKAKRLITPK